MRIFLLTLLSLILNLSANHTLASPAYPKPIIFTQPDGNKITISLNGDEHTKWATTTDGYSLIFDAKGYYEYASLDSRGYMIPSGIIAHEQELRSSEEVAFITNTTKDIRYGNEQLAMLRSIHQIQRSEAKRSFPTTGNRKLVCILMGFKDIAFTKTKADFENLFNQENYATNGATGSVRDFYKEDSYGKLNLSVKVAGPYTAKNTMNYYGVNDGWGYDLRPDSLVSEAVRLANLDINYADFDNDGDGNVDGIHVIYAGYGEEAGASINAIWAHSWEIPAVKLDGKTIRAYACSPELAGNSGTALTGIGVICHEFGHVLGAPDFYDTDGYNNNLFEGTGQWDIMASGSWNNNGITPAHHNAFTKTYLYNWGTVTELNSSTTIKMPPSAKDESAFYRINTTTANEFFLLENRQQEGFDTYIPGHGMIIYHIHGDLADHIYSNDINTKAPQMVYPICASSTRNPGYQSVTYGLINSSGCTYPGTANKTCFTDNTTPWARSWGLVKTAKPITNISENNSDKSITFDFMGLLPDFSANMRSASTIDPVIFIDESIGNPTSWFWNFGDGATPATASTAGPHTVTYATPGSKTVILTVNEILSESKSEYITIANTPIKLVNWDFEDMNTIADRGISENLSKTITCSASGITTYGPGYYGSNHSLSNYGWEGGSGTKSWTIEFSTLGYSNITISSVQKSSNSGPKHFKLQYSTISNEWVDVPSGLITVANDDFSIGKTSKILLPTDANNQPSVSVQWVMASNDQVLSGDVELSGTSRIDEVYVYGETYISDAKKILSIAKIGNGAITPIVGNHIYDIGSSVILTATPDQGWKFDNWEINGNIVTTPSTEASISSHTTAIATFSIMDGATEVINQIKVYPNPVSANLRIESSNLINTIKVFDLQGRMLLHHLNILKLECTLDLSGIPVGIYFIKLETIDHNTRTIKIIKQ